MLKKRTNGFLSVENLLVLLPLLPEASERPKKLTERDKRHLKAIVTKNWRKPVEKIRENFNESTGNNACRCTMQQKLYEMGYNSCTALRNPSISENNRKIRIRLNWARGRRLSTIDDCKKNSME
ncbi:unnamed protein product [Rhizophagus irregularis]|nr:unnamed protein product [Rhizophagus irregularis]